jgi:hypothetical protein
MLASEFQQPRLTRREKDTLTALRSAGLVSAPQLSRILSLDPDNTRKRLRSLVAKCYALRIHLPRGYRYFATPNPVDPSLKASVGALLQTMSKEIVPSEPVISQLTRDQQSDISNQNLPELQR